MGILDIFKRKAEPVETRSSGGGYTAQIMSARQSYISGATGLGELTATVQSCVSLYEGGLGMADVVGTDLLTRRAMAIAARGLALRGEALFLIRDTGLIPVSDWDVSTRDGRPRAYRVSVSEAGGGRTETALAPEVMHFRLASDAVSPWTGQSPLRRSQITAQLLHTIEQALTEIYQTAPLASQIIPFPESPDTDLDALGRGFRGKRGGVLLRESVSVTAAGGPQPSTDWRPQSVSPDIEKAMMGESLEAAKHSIALAFGIHPARLNAATTGPMLREIQRDVATWTLQPIALAMAEEASDKLGQPVEIDTLRPLQAYDAGGRARALKGHIEALAAAKAAGLSPGEVAEALRVVDLDK